jgi:CRP-like cAMP-binding protein
MPQASLNGSSEVLARKLASIAPLGYEERAALLALPMQIVEIRADQDILRAGDRPSRCCLMLEGFASINKITGEGKRQIMAFQIAGDVSDLQSVHLRTLDSNITSMTPCRVAFIRHEAVRELSRRFPQLMEAFWRATLIDAAIFREWIVNIGQREAAGRIAHVLCETFLRLRAVGLVESQECQFPVTQQRLAEATGMTTVHVNRTLQFLRSNRLIELKNGTFKVLDWEGLQETGDFDPEYLHFTQDAEHALLS